LIFRKDGLLYTGHGVTSWYYNYGKASEVMVAINNWLVFHPTEIVVVYIGAILGEQYKGIEELKTILRQVFNGIDGNVSLNNDWQNSQFTSWPTLGKAKRDNKRVFAIITSEEINPSENTDLIIEQQVKDGKPEPIPVLGGLSVLSTYKAQGIGSQCNNVLNHIEKVCREKSYAKFVKLAVFGPYTFGTCLWDLARTCNSRLTHAVNLCKSNFPVINFIQSDYPNYPGPKGGLTSVEVALLENQKNVDKFFNNNLG
jgi:hypothetical protein